MPKVIATLFVCLALLLVGGLPVLAQEDVHVSTTSNNFFQVAGTDFISVQFVSLMAQETGEYVADTFPLSNALSIPILVQLVPSNRAEFDVPYVIRPQPNGEVSVSIRWGEDTEYGDVCQALASAFLVRSAIWRFGHSAAPEVPDWLELGVGLGLKVHLRPALLDEILVESREEGAWSLDRILEIKGSEAFSSPEARRQCLWLVMFLQNQSPDRVHYRRLMAGFLKNLPPYELLRAGFPEKLDKAPSIEMWWAVGYQASVRARQAPFFDLNKSSRVLRNASQLTAEIDGQDVRIGVHELYGYRGNTAFAKAARQRVREVKLDLQKINPVYYNTLLSVGLLYDAWLALAEPDEDRDEDDEPTDEELVFAEAYAAFERDLKAAQLLDLEIKRLLDW